MTGQTLQLSLTIPHEQSGQRLDQALAALLPDYSRSRLKAWIESGAVCVDGVVRRPRDKVFGGEAVAVRAALPAETRVAPQEIPLVLVHEDRHLLVVDKPAASSFTPAPATPTAPCRTRCWRSTRSLRPCRAPESCIASTRTPAGCWSSRARCLRTPPWCACSASGRAP